MFSGPCPCSGLRWWCVDFVGWRHLYVAHACVRGSVSVIIIVRTIRCFWGVPVRETARTVDDGWFCVCSCTCACSSIICTCILRFMYYSYSEVQPVCCTRIHTLNSRLRFSFFCYTIRTDILVYVCVYVHIHISEKCFVSFPEYNYSWFLLVAHPQINDCDCLMYVNLFICTYSQDFVE